MPLNVEGYFSHFSRSIGLQVDLFVINETTVSTVLETYKNGELEVIVACSNSIELKKMMGQSQSKSAFINQSGYDYSEVPINRLLCSLINQKSNMFKGQSYGASGCIEFFPLF